MTARSSRRALLAASLVALVAFSPFARSALGGPPTSAARFVSPGSFGTVDFGDRILYRLTGAGCSRDAVHVDVATQPSAPGAAPASVSGPDSSPVVDPLDPSTCEGYATVPEEAQVRATKWDQGDPVSITLVSKHDQVPLRYERVEAAWGNAVAGSPTVVTPSVADPRAGVRERAVQMQTGDVLDFGRLDLTRIDSISLRVCVTLPQPHVGPSRMELRELSPTGPSVIGTIDVGNDYPAGSPQTKSNFGWPNCWQLQPFPIDGPVTLRAPELFLALVSSASPVQVEYVDFNGTGAKAPDVVPVDPPGTQPMPFDAAHWAMTSCSIDDDGTVHNVPDTSPQGYAPAATGGLVGPAGCTMQYTQPLDNVLIRFEMKFGTFADNGAVLVNGHEVQMRIAGEWLVGGLYGNGAVASNGFLVPTQGQQAINSVTGTDLSGGGFPAERLKINSYDDWNEFEIVQLGARYIVRVNGRTVADSATIWPAPTAPYLFSVASQPQFGYDYQVHDRYDNSYSPSLSQPAAWSNLVWRNFRVYHCTSTTDPVCTTGVPGING